MTNSQIATIANVLAVGVVLIISLLTSSRYHRWFFRYWTLANLAEFTFLLADVIAQNTRQTIGLSLVEVTSGAFGLLFFLFTGDAILQKPAFRRSAVLASGAFIISFGMIVVGLPSSAFMSPIALLIFYAILRLGMILLRVGRNPENPQTTFLAVPLILLALMPLTFPLLAPTPYVWVGYVAGSLLQITVGTGMVLFLLEQMSTEMRAQQKAIDAAKSEFLSCVSHELRTPLAIIVGYAELLARDLKKPDDPEAYGSIDFVDQIRKATTRLTGVINDLLDYSQIESNRLSYQFDEDDLIAVVKDALDNIRAIALQAGVEFEFEAPDHPILMRLDSNRMTQALHNLLGNAIKFSPPKGKVEVRVTEEPDGTRVTITDQGPGIPQELQAQVFEKFYQVDSRTTRSVGGLGLGLAICKAIIAEHRGSIGVEDGPEGGSSFWFKLPLKRITSPLNPAVTVAPQTAKS